MTQGWADRMGESSYSYWKIDERPAKMWLGADYLMAKNGIAAKQTSRGVLIPSSSEKGGLVYGNRRSMQIGRSPTTGYLELEESVTGVKRDEEDGWGPQTPAKLCSGASSLTERRENLEVTDRLTWLGCNWTVLARRPPGGLPVDTEMRHILSRPHRASKLCPTLVESGPRNGAGGHEPEHSGT
ncbi:hypothetical protein CROQUDRAFT_132530 [Cronartium quercuum f. sp. fusiforme G11]|uniref:Uncharacterized protein n=1 Tax=Cronartium quercuum f. sp. fusiforme G11 TaxID=708437 RepID=A0A9P6NID2_9BASI|nr:hypothetical protein CROQUDRAFT_132530 [Cronartium quercuum f. sp. fusiforme G11]